MNKGRFSADWLFKEHSKEEIKRWVDNLKFSYFKRAAGGYSDDGDEFNIGLDYHDKGDLFDILERLGVELNLIPKDYPKPISGKAYTNAEFSIFKNEIKDYPEYEQPKHIEINTVKCFCWIENGKIAISLLGGQDGSSYEVTQTDFENCKRIEQLIIDKNLTDRINREFEESVTCISKARYWDLLEQT